MKLAERLKNVERKYFFDPVHASPYYPNTVSIIKKSDVEFFEKYANQYRDDDIPEEFSELDSHQIDMVFHNADSVLDIVVDDHIFEDDKKIYEYMLSKHRIIGERCKWGQYPEERKDFLGNVLESVDYKFFANSWMQIGEERFLSRNIFIESDSYEENITFFNKKDRKSIFFQIQEDEYGEYSHMLEEDDYGDRERFTSNVRFVENLDSNKQIMDSLKEFMESDWQWDEDDEAVRVFERRDSIINFTNPIEHVFQSETYS